MNASNTAFPRMRESLGADYADLSDEQLDFVAAEIYGEGVTAEDVESFWSDLGHGFQGVAKGIGHFAQQAAPVLGKALPGIAQGAMTGATVGGPFGAIAGALAGGAGGILSQSKDPTLRGIGGAIGGVSKLASGFTGGGALSGLANIGLGALGGGGGRGGRGTFGNIASSALGALGKGGGPAGAFGNIAGAALGALQGRGGSGAIGQLAGTLAPQIGAALGAGSPGGSANALLGLLSRPETLQALSAAALGRFGRPNVTVGMQPVPVESILNAISDLAERAGSEAESTAGESMPAYYYNTAGELAIDPAESHHRTDALLTYLALTAPRWVAAPTPVVVTAPAAPAPAQPQIVLPQPDAAPIYTDADAAADAWIMDQVYAESMEGENAYA